MTEALLDRLSSIKPPFSEKVLIVDDVRTSMAFTLFEKCIREIKNRTKLVLLSHDWLEHDGYITGSKELSPVEVLSNFPDSRALESASPGDFRVRLLFHSSDFEIMFRVYFQKEDEDIELEKDLASFDLTTNEFFRAEIESFLAVEGVPYTIRNAAEYFRGLAC